jgi:capsular polysaccharide biosynthesis protein
VSDELTDFRSSVSTLRRHRRVLAIAALVGLVAGGAYALVPAPPLTSTTLVLLPIPAVAESGSSDIETQVQVALSSTVLERAGQAVVPALTARSVKKMVAVSGPTNQLLRIEATSRKAAQAQAVSQAVAESYVGYVSKTEREVTEAALADLTVRRQELQQQIGQLQDEINASTQRQRAVKSDSPEGRKEGRLFADLLTEQADLSVQLDKVKDKIAVGGDVSSTSTSGTTVLQNASEPTGLPPLLRLLIWAPLGAVAFTILTSIVLLVAARQDPRVRLRDEIADAVGSPVLGAVRSMPQQSIAGWATLLETYEATPVESWAFRQVLRGALPDDLKHQHRVPGKIDHPQSVSIVSLTSDKRGLAIAPQLAAFASSVGITTHLVTAVGHQGETTLWAENGNGMGGAQPIRPGLYVGDMPDGTTVDLSIYAVVLDRGQPRLVDVPVSEATILAVAAGTATEQELARVAIAVDDAGRHIDGIVVADPDETDRTSGRHTMDERSRRSTLPTRLTGIASLDTSLSRGNRSRS